MFNYFVVDLSYLFECINYRFLLMGGYKVVVYFLVILYFIVFNVRFFIERLLWKYSKVGQDYIFIFGFF